MNPRIAKKGKSFKGVMDYLMHDKRETGKAPSSDRVGFAHTHNLSTDDPKRATAHMIDLANNAHKIIIANGGKKPRTGSPVLHFSLGWHPDDKVSDDQMIEASIASLKKLGMHKHQAIFIKHLDGDHQHIHVVANRVHPETGVMAKLKNDRIKLGDLATELNNKYGWKHAKQRLENQNKRAKGEWVKHSPEYTREEWLELKARKDNFWQRLQEDQKRFSARHTAEREALHNAKEQQINHARELIKKAYRPEWSALYDKQRRETEEYKEKTQTAFGRAKAIMQDRLASWDRQGLAEMFNMIRDKEKIFSTIEARQQAERTKLSNQVKTEHRDQLKLINKSYKMDRLSLDQQQREQQSSYDKDVHQRIKGYRMVQDDFYNSSDHEPSQEQDTGRERERTRDDSPKNTPD